MSEAPQSHETALTTTSMMIAAYRAARLNQRPTQWPTPAADPAGGMTMEGETVHIASGDMGDPNLSTSWPGSVRPEGESENISNDRDEPGHRAEDAAPVATAPGLSAIGLGPSMLVRLNQLGLRTVQDIALSEPDDLRTALGSASRLLDIEGWIVRARQLQSAYAA
ncbi:MAG TPA: hypothetical protein VHB27_21185 [Rhodopila sp.]|uniref:hypothetical protein n=1 Tax=Rhodopila sp. TaxID=2480087 RepID=UPI002C2D5E1F|nr:hypothetical protein [Rhodopila sp.]HVY17748.1 hypothetical protein [Rhodopila sp.]